MKHKKLLTFYLIIFLISSIVLCNNVNAYASHSFTRVSKPALQNNKAVTFIVEVEDGFEHQKVFSNIQISINQNAEIGFIYTTVFNGFSLDGTIDQLDKIKALNGVKNVYVSSDMQVIESANNGGIQPLLDSAVDISNTDTAYNSGYNGEGMVIAIIDAGCDTSHDFFKTEPKNPRYTKDDIETLVKTLPLNADVKTNNDVYKNAKIPYAYNYTNNNTDTKINYVPHGTHVAGIAAGKNGITPNGTVFSGVAPEAQLLILSCATDSCKISMDAALAALNDAVLLGADVINMSFGISYADALYDDVFAPAFSLCYENGISLIAGSGNDLRGYNENTPSVNMPDYGTISSPANNSMVTAVSSVNNSGMWSDVISLEAPDGIEYTAFPAHESDNFADAFNASSTDLYLEYVDCGQGYPEQINNVSGKLALVKRGGLSFTEKADNLKQAGAVGIIIYNNVEGTFYPVELGIPTAVLTLDEGLKLSQRADKRLCYKGMSALKFEIDNSFLVSDFSSWGVSSNLELKPEIAAPGGSIYSSGTDNKYETLDGTSMATPYISGITALSRQYYKSNPFLSEFNGKTGGELIRLIENLMMNSANVVRQTNGVPYSPRVQGAGLADMNGILNSRVLLTGDNNKAKISLGDSIGDTFNIEFDITNISQNDITFDKISIEVLTDGYVQDPNGYLVCDSVILPAASVSMPESVTVLSSETSTFNAEVKLDLEFLAENEKIFTNGFYIEGYVFLDNETDSNLKASIPFMGFYGDWGKAPVFDNTIYDESGSYFEKSVLDDGCGTYLAASYEWGLVPLGFNPFFTDTANEKHISFSSNGQAALNFAMTNFRATNNPKIIVKDSNGNIVIENEFEDIYTKYNTHFLELPYNIFNGLDDGNYTLLAKATAAGCSSSADELEIPFSLDNTYPEITSVVYNESSKTITVKAKENHYFSAFYIAYPVDGEMEFNYVQITDDDYAPDGSVTKVLDASMIDNIYEAEIGCVDFALNETYYRMDYFLDDFGAEISNLEQLDNTTYVAFNIKNNTVDDFCADFVVAFYNSTGNVIATSIQNFEIDANNGKELTYSISENTQDAEYINLFVLDIKNLKPLDALKQFCLQ